VLFRSLLHLPIRLESHSGAAKEAVAKDANQNQSTTDKSHSLFRLSRILHDAGSVPMRPLETRDLKAKYMSSKVEHGNIREETRKSKKQNKINEYFSAAAATNCD
jgi:hypothetical protein